MGISGQPPLTNHPTHVSSLHVFLVWSPKQYKVVRVFFLCCHLCAATRCYGSRQDQFPPGNLFIAVSEGLWDNGAACGRRYRLRCLSGNNRPCKDGTIDVKVVDYCTKSPCPSTILMSNDAFSALSRSPDAKINIEYIQYNNIYPSFFSFSFSSLLLSFFLMTYFSTLLFCRIWHQMQKEMLHCNVNFAAGFCVLWSCNSFQ